MKLPKIFMLMNMICLSINGMEMYKVKVRYEEMSLMQLQMERNQAEQRLLAQNAWIQQQRQLALEQQMQHFNRNLLFFSQSIPPFKFDYQTTDDNNQTYSQRKEYEQRTIDKSTRYKKLKNKLAKSTSVACQTDISIAESISHCESCSCYDADTKRTWIKSALYGFSAIASIAGVYTYFKKKSK